jgi:hypothetical protein
VRSFTLVGLRLLRLHRSLGCRGVLLHLDRPMDRWAVLLLPPSQAARLGSARGRALS